MRFLRQFLLFRSLFRWRQQIEWTDVDGRCLQGFLITSTGRKLRVMIENETVAMNELAALSRGDAWVGGCACGFKALWAFIKGFSAQPEESPTSNEPVDELERFHP